MKLPIVAAAALLAGAAQASTVAIWRGPGPNACHGACPLDWAVEQLTAAQRAQVLAAMDEGGARPILVHRGDVFEFMSYQQGGRPYVDRRRTVAGMEEPARAWGWRFDGGSFVQLEACGNWAPVVHAEQVALAPGPMFPGVPSAVAEPTAVPFPAAVFGPFSGGDGGTSVFTSAAAPPPLFDRLVEPSPPTVPPGPPPEGPPPLPPTSPPVAAVPTPPGAALLLVAMGAVWLRLRRRPA